MWGNGWRLFNKIPVTRLRKERIRDRGQERNSKRWRRYSKSKWRKNQWRQRWKHIWQWKENRKEEETHKKSFQQEIKVRCREQKKEKEVGNKSQESGRVASQERKGRKKAEKAWVEHANITFPEKMMKEQRQWEKNWGPSLRENETLKILIKIEMLGGSFRKSAQLFRAAHSDQPQCWPAGLQHKIIPFSS